MLEQSSSTHDKLMVVRKVSAILPGQNFLNSSSMDILHFEKSKPYILIFHGIGYKKYAFLLLLWFYEASLNDTMYGCK